MNDWENSIAEHHSVLVAEVNCKAYSKRYYYDERDKESVHKLEDEALLYEGHYLVSAGSVALETGEEPYNKCRNGHVDDVDNHRGE